MDENSVLDYILFFLILIGPPFLLGALMRLVVRRASLEVLSIIGGIFYTLIIFSGNLFKDQTTPPDSNEYSWPGYFLLLFYSVLINGGFAAGGIFLVDKILPKRPQSPPIPADRDRH